jgi:branched-chain amino acid aminotransferase
MSRVYYVDGEWVDAEEATVPMLDYGFLYGDSCYDDIAINGGVVFDLDRRLERFFNSAKMLRLVVPVAKAELKELVLEAAVRNAFHESPRGYLRPHLSRGFGHEGVFGGNRGPGTLRIIANSAGELPSNITTVRGNRDEIGIEGAILSSYERTTNMAIDPRVKFSYYATSILSNFEAADRGAKWSVFRNRDGFIREASGGNVFVYRRETLWTPPVTEGLDGVTHRRVMEVARELGYECVETNLTRYDLVCADELFVSSGSARMDAISSFEGTPLPDPVPGPVTTALYEAYIKSAMAAGTPVPTTMKVS